MVPKSLRIWFVIHFAVDMLFGIPLIIAPEVTLSLFGWDSGDAFLARVVGAALLGIGGESFLGRDSGVEGYRGMLRLKLIWSSAAIAGMTASLLSGDAPAIGWLLTGVFGVFFVVWLNYWRHLNRLPG